MNTSTASASTKGIFQYKIFSGTPATSAASKKYLTSNQKTADIISQQQQPHTAELVEEMKSMSIPDQEREQGKRSPLVSAAIINEQVNTANTINSKLNIREFYKVKKTVIYCLFIAMSGFIFGYDIGIIGGLVNFPSFRATFARGGNGNFSRVTIGLLVGVSNISSCLSGLLANYLTKNFGRKVAILIALSFYCLGDLIIISAQTSGQVAFGRICNGCGIGISSVAAPMFISELPQQKLKGTLMSTMQLMTTSGILAGSLALYFSKNFRGFLQYNMPLYISMVFSTIAAGCILVVPESPVFLIQKELEENAAEVIAHLNNLKKDHWYVKDRLHDMRSRLKKRNNTAEKPINTNDSDHSFSDNRIKSAKLLHRSIVGMAIMIFQQFTGINYFFFYGTSIFRNAGVTDPYVTSIILAAVNLLFSMVSLSTTDRFPRKTLLISGSSMMFCCMAIFSTVGAFALGNGVTTTGNSTAGSIMIAVTCAFIAAFTLSWGPVSFMVVSELFPYEFKAKGMSLASSANWIATFLISFCTSFIVPKIGFLYGYFFCSCLLLSVIFVIGFIPETKGVAIDLLDQVYATSDGMFWKGTNKKLAVAQQISNASPEPSPLPQPMALYSPKENQLRNSPTIAAIQGDTDSIATVNNNPFL